MHSLADKLEAFSLSNGLAALLENVSRMEGEARDLSRLPTDSIERLQQSSVITSSVASCAIEGIHVTEERMQEVARTSALTREEREVLNYKLGLDFLFSANRADLFPTPNLLRKLHSITMDGIAGAGQYKVRDNQIIERTPAGDRIRFLPTSAVETPDAIEALFAGFNEAINKQLAPAHVAIAFLILGVTCIHPFADGNGRTSRLLTTAALLERGIQLPRFVSLEELIRDKEEFYYQALHASSTGWSTGIYDATPFVRFHLETLQAAFQILQHRLSFLEEAVEIQVAAHVPDATRIAALALFRKVYPNATMTVFSDMPAGCGFRIAGYDSCLPQLEFDCYKHATHFARQCFAQATTPEKF